MRYSAAACFWLRGLCSVMGSLQRAQRRSCGALQVTVQAPKNRRRNALSMVQLRSGFGPTPSPIEPNFRRLTTIECEKDTPVDRCGKASQASDCIDFIGESLEARAGIEPAHKGFADLSLTTWVPRLGPGLWPISSHSAVYPFDCWVLRNGAGDET